MAKKEDLAVLRAVRGNLKGSLTKAALFTEKFTEAVLLELLLVRMEKLDELWQKFSATQEQLYRFQEVEGFVDPEQEFDEFESKFLVVKSVLLSAIRERQKPKSDTAPPIPASNLQSPSVQQLNTSCSSQHFNDHLPKNHIEPFSGSYHDWPSFRDMYGTAVHNKANLSPTQKFQLLRSHLRGPALSLLNHIPVSDATYEQAWDRLEKRYDHPRFIVNDLVETFMQLPSIHSVNVRTLRKISDGADEIVRGLNSLNIFERDPWMIHVLVGKVDPETRQGWSTECMDVDYPTIGQFLTFLERRCEALESCKGNSREPTREKVSSVRSMHVSSSVQCPKCSASHTLAQCSDFMALDIESRRDFVKSKGLCFNCLRGGHKSGGCQSRARCKNCNSRHHTLVHLDTTHSKPIPENKPAACSQNPNQNYISTSLNLESGSSHNASTSAQCIQPIVSNHQVNTVNIVPKTLLPTAIGKVLDKYGNYQSVRILIDSGSQVSFVTESCVQRLGLRRVNARIPIIGVGATCAGKTRGLVSLVIGSRFDAVSIRVHTYILSNVTSELPAIEFDVMDWDHISKLELADPQFSQPSAIDILLGADKAWEIIQGEVVRSAKGYPVAQKTIFGWVLAGQLPSESDNHQIRSHHTIVDIDATLQAFWTIEEIDPKSILSKEEVAIEEHFCKTHRRSNSGKYIVRLPFKTTPQFADTLKGATSRLFAMEKRFSQDTSLFESYSKFMEEYLALGNMRRIPPSEISRSNVFYLPHHAVFKPDSSTTKLRVVFDGSFKDAVGKSLNDSLMIGPTIQRNLFSVCLRFRRHKFVFTADIVKMFREIWISEEDTDFQRIVWRKSRSDPIEHFRLCTVTYGTSCAPYESVRVLQQLAQDYREEFPVAAEILTNDFYVDDVVSGGDSLPDAIFKKNSLIELLSKGGLSLSKWQSNSPQLLGQENQMQEETLSLDSELDSVVKVLGLYWNSRLDSFSFRLNLESNEPITKAQILSDIARIFDPLGFLAPSVIQFKIMLQELWHQKLSWKEPLPDCIALKWKKYREEIPLLTTISIPRCIGIVNDRFQLHGFSDASMSAYSAVVYSRHILPDGTIGTNILAAKTRVAPLKQLTIPRLELCGALLLARLLVAVQRSLNTTGVNVFAWCDSNVVLSWLSSPPRRWDIFVGNRTAEILSTIPRNRWYHVKSDQNPADCASRGIAPSNLVNHALWWTGPNWLVKSEEHWPIMHHTTEHPDCLQEERVKSSQRTCYLANIEEHPYEYLSSRVKSWSQLILIVSFVHRFTLTTRKLAKYPSHRLLSSEVFSTKRNLLRWLQNRHFEKDIAHLKQHGYCGKNSKIASLNPFLDDEQLLRVGGRIQEANIPFSVKHPIIIPKGDPLTRLIAIDFHQRLLHPGVSTLFSLIRQEFWIIGCRNLLRKITSDCSKCFQQGKTTCKQIMGNLPPPRIHPSRPFTHCGVDYAGPISLKTKIGRKSQITKGYISLFVCLATKAIHLELVSDLTTEAFLGALRRFVARRGKPAHIYSDNGTNFRGSTRRLSDMQRITLSEHHNSLVAESLALDAITWHFIPPSSPHFGGLWEAGVKSVKLHLCRVIGTDVLSFEDYYTLLTQIEALLNCRPLCQKSDNDIDPLTPAHFIIGETYAAVPEPSLEVPLNRLASWQALQAKVQGYWKRWSMEYLTSLQQRPRWTQPKENLKQNDLVAIKEPNLPPGKWIIGRVIATHPGRDGYVRVVTLRTSNGTIVRPIHKLAPLPLS